MFLHHEQEQFGGFNSLNSCFSRWPILHSPASSVSDDGFPNWIFPTQMSFTLKHHWRHVRAENGTAIQAYAVLQCLIYKLNSAKLKTVITFTASASKLTKSLRSASGKTSLSPMASFFYKRNWNVTFCKQNRQTINSYCKLSKIMLKCYVYFWHISIPPNK